MGTSTSGQATGPVGKELNSGRADKLKKMGEAGDWKTSSGGSEGKSSQDRAYS